jgi:PadR family transcriptional regulator PadR
MAPRSGLGEFEQLVLLAVLARGNECSAMEIAEELEGRGGRSVSRGALYSTMERLKKKDLLDWRIDENDIARSGHPRRHFTITSEGIRVLREARATLLSFWDAAGEALVEN